MAIAKKISSNMIFTPPRLRARSSGDAPIDRPPDLLGSAEDQTTEPQAPVPPIPLLPPAPPHADTTRKWRASPHGHARCFTTCACSSLARVWRFPILDRKLLMCSPDAHGQPPSR